jgi:hypothetical protein
VLVNILRFSFRPFLLFLLFLYFQFFADDVLWRDTAAPEDVPMTGEGDEDAELARALAMSRGEEDVAMAGAEGEEELDEEEQIRRAIEMSVRDQGGDGHRPEGGEHK